VYQAELEVAAASADVGTAQADRYPRLSLSGSIAAGRVRVAGTDSDAQTWSIGPLALSVPLFDGGRRAANADAVQARYEAAVTSYRARVRQAVSEVEQALVTLASAQARNADALTAVEGYRSSFTATEERYRGGLASLVELEDARRTLLAAETGLVALQRERAASWVALYRATGGGWRRDAAALSAATP
jgi:outer membrane protein TolC